MAETICWVCRAPVPDVGGPVSPQSYLPQSPGCWRLYTEILAREYGEWGYPEVHRLTVDAYAAQHPTAEADPKSAQSVTVHLLNIHLVRQRGMSSREVLEVMRQILDGRRLDGRRDFPWLEPPASPGAVTVADVHRAADLDEHVALVERWADAVWTAWAAHHAAVLGLLER